MNDYDTFLKELLETVPEFKRVYDEHLAANGEALPHVLVGALVRFLFDAYIKSNSPGPDAAHWHSAVERILALMEEAMGSADSRLTNLVSVSFLENLIPSREADRNTYKAIKPQLGPLLQRELKYYDV